MNKVIFVSFIILSGFLVSCKKRSARVHVTTPIIAGALSNYYFLYHKYPAPIQIKLFEDTGRIPVLYTDTHLPNYFLVKYPPNDKNVISFAAGRTLHAGSRYPGSSQFSQVMVSGSSNVSVYSKPLQKGDSILNSLDWVSSVVLTTNDTALSQGPIFHSASNSFEPAPPYVKGLWTKTSYLATRLINANDTTFGWIELRANEDSVSVSIFQYGQQY